MSQPVLIGITGGIGAGKSIVARIFAILGVPVYDADSRAKSLMVENDNIVKKVKELFGEASYKYQSLNRQHVASQAFYHPEKLEKLNQLVHPEVGRDFSRWVNQQKARYLLKEAALLFEAGSYKQLDKLITVTCPEDLRIRRVLSRDKHRNEEDVRNIIDKQWPEKKKAALSDYIIKNDESESVIKQVLQIHHLILHELA